MKIIRILFTALVFILITSCSPDQEQNESKNTSSRYTSQYEYINSIDPRKTLFTLSWKAAQSTTTWKILTKELGKKKAKNLVGKEIMSNLDRYLTEWTEGMESAYKKYFSAEEMDQLSNNAYMIKNKDRIKLVGLYMQKNSSGIVKEITTESLTSVYKRMVNNETNKI